jgi:hypothetical protein
MTEPVKAGDDCLVIDGLAQHKSPNVGQRVRVVALRGEHSKLGRIWRCEGESICQLHPETGAFVVTGYADFPAAWLKKIKPDAPPAKNVAKKDELTL